MPKVYNRVIRNGVEYMYLSHCCGFTRKQIAKKYNVPVKNVKKLDSYIATIYKRR